MGRQPSGDNAPDGNETHGDRHHSTETAADAPKRAKAPRQKTPTDLVLMRARWEQGESGSNAQRQNERDDLAFYGGKMWPDAVEIARKGTPANANTGTPPTPARPLITVNLCKEPIRQVLNQERQSDYGIELVPADDFGEQEGSVSHEEIELREGLVRRIQRQSEAQVARNWAFERATICGQGFYLVELKYVSDRSSDRELCISKILNQFGVMLDPAHEADDGSDADWGFVGSELEYSKYVGQFGGLAGKGNRIAEVVQAGATDGGDMWRALGDEAPGWFTTSGKVRYVRLMKYYHVERSLVKVLHWANGMALPADQPPPMGIEPMLDEDGEQESRYIERKVVRITTTEGLNILEETEWVTSTLPIVKVLGEALHPYDRKRETQGMIRNARSSNEGFNWLLSRGVETVALQPIPPLMLASGQQEGFEAWYASLATRALPYVIYNFEDKLGNKVGPPQRAPNNADLVTPIVGLLQLFQGLVKSTTGIPDVALGNVDPTVRSKAQLKEMLRQAEKATNNFLDNLQTSMRYEARLLNEALPIVYGRPGRMAQMVSGDGEASQAILHQPFVMGGSNGKPGRPMPAQPGQQGAKLLTLTKGVDFNVAISVGKNFDTRREEEADEVGDLIAADPTLMTWFGDIYFKNQDGPGHEEMAKRASAMLAPPIQQMIAGQEPLPPQVQAQMQGLQQQLQQTQQQLQEAMQAIQTKQVEKSFDLQKAREDNQTKITIAEINQAGAFAVADLKAGLEAARTSIEALKEERIAMEQAREQGRDHTHEHAVTARQHRHELMLGQLEHERALEAADQAQRHILEQGAMGAGADQALAEQQHGHKLEQGQQANESALQQADQAAALQPPPAGGEA
jgi:hypothetical protein